MIKGEHGYISSNHQNVNLTAIAAFSELIFILNVQINFK